MAGGWGGCRGSSGSHRALACLPAQEQPSTPGASLPDPSLELLAHLLVFFNAKKAPKKTPNLSDTAVYNLLAGCSETVTEAPLASSTPFNRLGKAPW